MHVFDKVYEFYSKKKRITLDIILSEKFKYTTSYMYFIMYKNYQNNGSAKTEG